MDQTGRIVEANSTARKLLKLSPGCEGKSFEESVGESYNITGYLKEGKGSGHAKSLPGAAGRRISRPSTPSA